jgi:hypothetical protein
MSKSACLFLARVLLTLLPLLAAGEAAAQALGIVNLGTWDGTLDTSVGYSRDLISYNGVAGPAFSQRNTSELLNIRNNGFFVLDPALLSGSVGVTLGMEQERASSSGYTTNVDSKIRGYSIGTSLLNDLPYGGGLFANRSQTMTIEPFGHVDTTTTNRGFTARLNEGSPLRDLGLPYLSGTVQMEQQHLQEISTSVLGQGASVQDQMRKTLSAQGHKGFETADLDCQGEVDDIEDQFVANGSYRSKAASLMYGVDFGPTLNRRLDSRMSYLGREGVAPMSLFSLNENLGVGIFNNLSANYGYQLTRLDALNISSLGQVGSFGLQYQPYQNLGASVSLQHQQQPYGTIDVAGGALAYHFERSLPWQGKLLVRLNGGDSLTDTHIQSSLANITDEAHVAPAAFGAGAGFMLNQSFALPASIVVVDTRGGALLQTVLGIDYELLQVGGQTTVIPLLTSTIIRPGDPMAVSYTYKIAPSLKYLTATKSASVTTNFGWISFNVTHNQSDVTLLAGDNSLFLPYFRNDSARMDLHGNWDSIQGAAGTSYLNSRSTMMSYVEQRYYQNVTYQYASNLGVTINSEWTLTDYQIPAAHQSDARSTNLTANWIVDSGLMVSAHTGFRYLVDTSMPTETVSDAGLRGRLSYGKLSVLSDLLFNRRVRDGAELSNWQVKLTVSRGL